MMGFIKDFGLCGSIGLLVGIALVSWVEPATAGGVGLLLVACTLVWTIFGGIWRSVRKKHKEKQGKENMADKWVACDG